jgi:nucleoside-diphosphate-sugar epimerase
MGSIADTEGLTKAAAESEGVIHLAFNHDFSTFAQNCEDDRKVIQALGAGLKGTNKPLLVTSGTMLANTVPGEPARETPLDMQAVHHPRAASEDEANKAAADGVNVGIIRLPQVHDTTRAGLVAVLIQTALDKGGFAYVADGANRWPAGHVDDVAKLYRLAIEKAAPGAIYHAVGEEGISVRDISEALGRRLKLPTKSITADEAPAHFGWFAMFSGVDAPASGAETRAKLGWHPHGRGLMIDLAEYDGPGM